jgi:hypothetical protein
MNARKPKLDSSLESASDSLTIYDAPNVCRDIMARCQTLASRLDSEVGNSPGALEMAAEVRDIGENAKRMLDAIMASVDKILAMEA